MLTHVASKAQAEEVEDGKEMLASLVVHPVRMVVLCRNQTGKSLTRYETQEIARLFGTIDAPII